MIYDVLQLKPVYIIIMLHLVITVISTAITQGVYKLTNLVYKRQVQIVMQQSLFGSHGDNILQLSHLPSAIWTERSLWRLQPGPAPS